MLTTGSRLESSHGMNAISAAAEIHANVTMKFDSNQSVEHDLQRSKAKRDEREADEIKIQALALPLPFAGGCRRNL